MIGLAVILITVWIILAISAIPLLIAVRLLGGEASIFKVILANLLVGLAGVLIYYQFPAFAGIITFVGLLLIYSMMFRISFVKALFAWILQGIIAFVLLVLAVILLKVPITLPYAK